ncbi:MAG: DUF3500 domain-containing protein [Bauldia sp.]
MLSRRTVLGGLGAAATLPALPRVATAQAAAAIAPAIPGIADRVNSFLSVLAPEKAAAARFPLDSGVWRGWNYFGNNLVKPGIRFEEMEPAEQDSGTELLVAMLSPAGFDRVQLVRALQDVLAAQGIGPADRNSNRYSLSIFDEPAADAIWGLRLEGHHLELTLTLRGDEVVSVTPSSFSCNPNDVPTGPYAGQVAVRVEEEAARALFADLSAEQQRVALISADPILNIRAVSGQEGYYADRAGLAAADMTTTQQDLLWQVVRAHGVEHWPDAVGAANWDRLRSGDQAAVHFAWAGGNEDGTRLYYRLHGDTFLIELAAVDPAAQHLHTIYHDTERTLGRHVL